MVSIFEKLGEEMSLQVLIRTSYLDQLKLRQLNRVLRKLLKSKKFRLYRRINRFEENGLFFVDEKKAQLVLCGKVFACKENHLLQSAVAASSAGRYALLLCRPERRSVCEDEVRAVAFDITSRSIIHLPPPLLTKTVATTLLSLTATEKHIFAICTNYRQTFSSLDLSKTHKEKKWRARPSLPLPVVEAACVATDTYVYVMGGREAKIRSGELPRDSVSKCQRFNVRTNEWQIIQSMPGLGRFRAVTTYHQGKIFIFGGFTRADTDTSQTTTQQVPFQQQFSSLVYDILTNSWSTLPALLPDARSLVAALVHNDRILLFVLDHDYDNNDDDHTTPLLLAQDYSAWLRPDDEDFDLPSLSFPSSHHHHQAYFHQQGADDGSFGTFEDDINNAVVIHDTPFTSPQLVDTMLVSHPSNPCIASIVLT